MRLIFLKRSRFTERKPNGTYPTINSNLLVIDRTTTKSLSNCNPWLTPRARVLLRNFRIVSPIPPPCVIQDTSSPGAYTLSLFRTEEGLPFVPLRFINILICSALARAQKLHQIRIICFVVQANHIHLLIRVTNPEDVSSFIRFFKAESAHYLTRLLNRRQRPVWAERFGGNLRGGRHKLCNSAL